MSDDKEAIEQKPSATEEEINKRVEALAQAKVKALQEKQEFERQKAELEKQKVELEQWKARYVEATQNKTPAPKPAEPKPKPKAEEAFKNLTQEQQIELYKDYQQRQYDLQLANFKAQVKAHITDNSEDLGHLGKLDETHAFRQIVDKMNDHKAMTGQSLSIVEASKMADTELKAMVDKFIPEKKEAVFDLENDPEYNLDMDKDTSPSLSQELEEKESSTTDTGKVTDTGKLPDNEADFVKQVFKESLQS